MFVQSKCLFFGYFVICFTLIVFDAGPQRVCGMPVDTKYFKEEYDNAHPQLPFLEDARIQMFYSRNKRATMPTIRFAAPEIERDAAHWHNLAQNQLEKQLEKNELNRKIAKNVIFFLGDGMSIPTLAATRIYMGGEEQELSFEAFPYTGLSKTYCANTQVADSACTATAYLSGVKANFGTIGVSASVPLNDCLGENNTAHHVESIAKWAQDFGMSTGLITTTQVTHASPAGVYAHTANRNWESNQVLLNEGGDPKYCTDIAKQLVHGPVGSKLKVIMGGGRREFLPTNAHDIEGFPGRRTDGINLIEEWKRKHHRHTAKYVQTKQELLNITDDTDYLLGLFHNSDMPFNLVSKAEGELYRPSLEEMVGKALDMLEKDKKGFFLFVEGGRIDHGHHEGHTALALQETVEFVKAIDLARKRTSVDDTLIVVTSDHSHTMSISGYSSRGNNILGINDFSMADDNLPYATINYASGPGAQLNMIQGNRQNLNKLDMDNKSFIYPSVIPLNASAHGGDDVGVFASGPWAHLFSGVYEQHFIPHAMGYASCIGIGKIACKLNS